MSSSSLPTMGVLLAGLLMLLLCGVDASSSSSSASSAIMKRGMAKVVTSCTQNDTVALTFDDGPWQYLKEVADTLTDAGVKGTFFFNGNNYQCIYDDDAIERIKYAYNQSHLVASHTWNHPDLTTLSWDQVHDEMWKVEQALERIVGVVPAFMRPPFGNYNDNVREVAFARNQTLVTWDFDSQDSVGASPEESKSLYDSVIADHPNTLLALNHEVIDTTVHDVLPYAIEQLQAAGYNLVTVAECLDMEAYQSVGEPGTKDDSWACDSPARCIRLPCPY